MDFEISRVMRQNVYSPISAAADTHRQWEGKVPYHSIAPIGGNNVWNNILYLLNIIISISLTPVVSYHNNLYDSMFFI